MGDKSSKERNANPGSRLTAITLSDKIREAETILKNANSVQGSAM